MDVVPKSNSVTLSSCQEPMRRQELIAWQHAVPSLRFTSSSEPLVPSWQWRRFFPSAVQKALDALPACCLNSASHCSSPMCFPNDRHKSQHEAREEFRRRGELGKTPQDACMSEFHHCSAVKEGSAREPHSSNSLLQNGERGTEP